MAKQFQYTSTEQFEEINGIRNKQINAVDVNLLSQQSKFYNLPIGEP